MEYFYTPRIFIVINVYKMKNKKTTINFTIEPELKKDFVNVSDKLGINRSKMISNFIRDWVNKSSNDLKDDKR